MALAIHKSYREKDLLKNFNLKHSHRDLIKRIFLQCIKKAEERTPARPSPDGSGYPFLCKAAGRRSGPMQPYTKKIVAHSRIPMLIMTAAIMLLCIIFFIFTE